MIPYLGVPPGAKPKLTSTWNPVINRIERKLAKWKGKLLATTGRLTLIKLALSILPLYYFSIFKIRKKVALKIEGSFRRSFAYVRV